MKRVNKKEVSSLDYFLIRSYGVDFNDIVEYG